MITDVKTVINDLTGWLRDKVEAAGKDGVVIGLSGGIDSAVACGLAIAALGPNRVTAVWLPCYSSPASKDDAEQVAKQYGIKLETLDLGPAFDTFTDATQHVFGDNSMLVAGNIKARLRMIALYAYANSRNLLVLGTTNKTEHTFGYYTKWGDGAVDLEIIQDLYKDEVRLVARHLPIVPPLNIITKDPSADLAPGQTDEIEIGATYKDMNAYARVANTDSTLALMSEETQNILLARIKANMHKMDPPPSPFIHRRRPQDPLDEQIN